MRLPGLLVALSLLIAVRSDAQRISVTSSRSSYAYGDTIQVSLRVWNDSDTSFTISSSTTCVAWILPDTVSYGMGCGFMDVDLVFNPGNSRTWIWHLAPSSFGYPTFTGRHCVRGVCKGGLLDSVFFDAPAYRGGRLFIRFYPGISHAVVDSIRASVDATSSWGFTDTSGTAEVWEVSGFPVDSLASAFLGDNRVKLASVVRSLSPDSLLVVAVPFKPQRAIGFRLNQNYPNPFNPSTVIPYTLSTTSAVSLRVYDLLGRKVADLVQGTQEAGEHTAEFDGAGLASGVYFCRLTAGLYVATITMLRVK